MLLEDDKQARQLFINKLLLMGAIKKPNCSAYKWKNITFHIYVNFNYVTVFLNGIPIAYSMAYEDLDKVLEQNINKIK